MLTVEFKIKGRAPIAAAVWLASVSMFIAQPVFAQNKVIATFTFPDTPINVLQNNSLPGSVTNDRKVLLGSVGSDLWHGPKDARDEFWMLTDRGPNGQIRVDGSNRRTFWVPEFNPSILRVKTEEKTSRILETIPIVGQSGKPVTGLPNLKGIDETPYNYSATEILPFNPNDLDTEGLVRGSSGDFWIAEEYSPSLVHLDRNGKVLKRYIPEGLNLEGTDYPVAQALPAIYGKRKINRGFEGIALSADEKMLYVVLLSPTTLLVLERTDLVAKLYSVDISQATNILNTKWGDPKTAPTLEALTDPAAAEVRALAKTLVLDLSSLDGMPEKIEGVALLDRNTIAVANDNDFDSEESQYDDAGNNIGKGKKSQILIISLAKPLALSVERVSAR